ncbi:MAG: sulfatase, partial [Solirubrobacterales bacterium]|nr:sulfatase [Solirubrobacterales bacterium]
RARSPAATEDRAQRVVPAPDPPGRPNLIVVMTDDQDIASMRVMKQTRRLLGERGVSFSNFYSSFPQCSPSRATLLSGQYAHTHGVIGNHQPSGGLTEFEPLEAQALPVALQASGYETALIGKYFNGYNGYGQNHPAKMPPGWDHWFAAVEERMFNWQANANGEIRSYPNRESDYQTDVYARQARGFIRRSSKRSRPFFLSVFPRAPHVERGIEPRDDPRPAPRHAGSEPPARLFADPAFNESNVSDKPSFVPRVKLTESEIARQRSRERDRLNSLRAVDDLVAGLVEELRLRGELANTYIAFTSDNGYMLGAHRLRKKNSLYEQGSRVPMLLRGPGLRPGTVAQQVSANVDIAPTLLAAAGADPLLEADGIDLRRLARNPEVERGRAILLETAASRAVRTRRWMYAEHDTDPSERGAEQLELYDMRRDPDQLLNLLGSLDSRPPLAELERLTLRLRALSDCAGETCR